MDFTLERILLMYKKQDDDIKYEEETIRLVNENNKRAQDKGKVLEFKRGDKRK